MNKKKRLTSPIYFNSLRLNVKLNNIVLIRLLFGMYSMVQYSWYSMVASIAISSPASQYCVMYYKLM